MLLRIKAEKMSHGSDCVIDILKMMILTLSMTRSKSRCKQLNSSMAAFVCTIEELGVMLMQCASKEIIFLPFGRW